MIRTVTLYLLEQMKSVRQPIYNQNHVNIVETGKLEQSLLTTKVMLI